MKVGIMLKVDLAGWCFHSACLVGYLPTEQVIPDFSSTSTIYLHLLGSRLWESPYDLWYHESHLPSVHSHHQVPCFQWLWIPGAGHNTWYRHTYWRVDILWLWFPRHIHPIISESSWMDCARGGWAFAACSSLEAVFLPPTVTHIDEYLCLL